MNKIKFVNGIIMMCIQLPIWYFMMYQLLDFMKADNLLWFLFWVYVPVGFFTKFLANFIESKEK